MPDQLLIKLEEQIKTYHPSNNFEMIEKAYRLAAKAHETQFRKSGEPYIIHPLSVALILAELELDKETISAAILHDVVEDTTYTIKDIEKEFSAEIALLVDGVTKLEKIPYKSSKEEIQAENFRKMFLAMAKDIRVILIKLADRLHNMRTLKYMSETKQVEIARETLELYAPLANRLGISQIKIELEDLSLRYLEPDAYYDLVNKISNKKTEREEYVKNIVTDVREHIESAGIEATVDGRPKHFFSIYKKMKNQEKSIDQIYDLFAVRAVVESVKDCYGVLGVIHEMYKPIPGRFKDYIAMPKENMYQSLHTTLIGPNGTPFEMQIRTYDMHRTAEFGIAAHWKYKEGSKANLTNQEEQKLSWLRQILEWQKDTSDNREFLDVIKTDLNIYSDHVYAFSPKGEVMSLPTGSTPIDFAYAIHSAVGNKMVGARVNNKIVTIDYEIKNGDRIEIITSQNSKGPSKDWLKIVKSGQAKNKINQWFRKEYKDDNIVHGKVMLEKYAKSKNINLAELLKPDWMDLVQKKYGFMDWDAVCAAIGHGGLKEGQVLNRLLEETSKKKMTLTDEEVLLNIDAAKVSNTTKKSKSGIIVMGLEDLAVRFSRCCSPVPGDEIIGYITKGRGVSIHRTDCINIVNMIESERERLIDAEWQQQNSSDKKALYQVELQIICEDRSGIIVDVSRVLTEESVPIKSMNARTTKGKAIINVVIQLTNSDQLQKVSSKLYNISSIYDIIRANT